MRTRFFWIINAVFLILWVALAFNVNSRSTWLLENVLVFFLVPFAIINFKKDYLSKTSYFFIFIFTSFHLIGAHYTYSLVPYDQWLKDIFGFSLNSVLGMQRNNYDRFLHFLSGLLLFQPLRQWFENTVTLKRGYLTLFTTLVLIAASTFYELIEYGAAVIFGGDLGIAYVGAQGDQWDAQKDQLLMLLGLVIGILNCQDRNKI